MSLHLKSQTTPALGCKLMYFLVHYITFCVTAPWMKQCYYKLQLSSMVFTQSKDHKHRGDYSAAKKYANVALSLMIVNIIYVLGGAVFGIGMSLGLHYQYLCTRSYSCKLSLLLCISVICIVTANIPKGCLHFIPRLLMRKKACPWNLKFKTAL